jgi:ubiquinol-cytochrome c reductase cytochrome c1 subunit
MSWRITILALLLVTVPLPGKSAGGGEGVGEFERAHTNLDDQASLQRGAKLFANYCLGCHSGEHMRYNRLAEDLELSDAQVENNLMFTADKIHEPMTIAMSETDQAAWFETAVPDLSLTARSRGTDWIYNYLKGFYVDPTRPTGWNNTVFPNAVMPNPLWRLQGVQVPEYEVTTNEFGAKERKLVGVYAATEGRLSEEEFDRVVRDLTTFLEYMGEPAKMKRESMGIWVLLFIGVFTFFAFLLKREYWRDVH